MSNERLFRFDRTAIPGVTTLPTLLDLSPMGETSNLNFKPEGGGFVGD